MEAVIHALTDDLRSKGTPGAPFEVLHRCCCLFPQHLRFMLSPDGAGDFPRFRARAMKKAAKQHAKQYRKARRGERRSRTVSKPAAKKKARAKGKPKGKSGGKR